MIHLNKEAVDYLYANFGSIHGNRSVKEALIYGATQSKYVQAEILKAQIEVLEQEYKESSGFNTVRIRRKIIKIEQQLNHL
jgi:hypothetical protein